MRSSTPFTNAPLSSVPKRLATSTASSKITARGTSDACEQLPGAHPQHVAVDARHALEAPILAGLLDLRVGLLEVLQHAAHERVRIGSAFCVFSRQLCPEVGDRALDFGAAGFDREQHL